MRSINELLKSKPWLGWVLFFTTALFVAGFGFLAFSIMERRIETKLTRMTINPLPADEVNNLAFKNNFPRQYERYLMTAKGDFQSEENGSVQIDELERDPRMVILWAGYAFSRDYFQSRGHAHSLEDIRDTLRTAVPQPGTCWTCKSPDVLRLMKEMGVAEFYKAKWEDLAPQIHNPIGCADCHDPLTMNLRISRPALIEALASLGKNVEDLTHNEMRSLVCAQCHVEYYFQGKTEKYLTFPWKYGLSVEDAEKYYDEIDFSDWTHSISKAPMLKAQHTDYEIWTKGTHAERGIACADCHMPYRSEGGVKFTDHWIQSPLNNISNSCQICHHQNEETLRNNVYSRQAKIKELRYLVENILVQLHYEAKAAWDAGATEEEMKKILILIRHAQWRWDYATAGHGNSFHAPLEVSRILGTAIDKAQEGRLLLARLLTQKGVVQPVVIPDISTKAKAQESIGLDMNKLKAEKQKFLETVIPLKE